MEQSRKLFTEGLKSERLSYEELQMLVTLSDEPKKKTRPVGFKKFIDRIIEILNTNGQESELDHVYVAEAGSKKDLDKEETFGNNAIECFIIDRCTGTISLPLLKSEEGMSPIIGFSFHDKGCEITFGHNVHDCSNMCIFGQHHLKSYGKDNSYDYYSMMEKFESWVKELPEMAARDREIFKAMREKIVDGCDNICIMGKLYILSVREPLLSDCIAPINTTSLGEVVRHMLHENDLIFECNYRNTLWNIYNHITYVLKPTNINYANLFSDLAEVSEFLIEEFGLVNKMNTGDYIINNFFPVNIPLNEKDLKNMIALIKTMPVTGENDTPDPIAYLHYFIGDSHWFITEKDKGDSTNNDYRQSQAFGWTILNNDFQNAELGYISIEELLSFGSEILLDIDFEPTRLSIIKERLMAETNTDVVEGPDQELPPEEEPKLDPGALPLPTEEPKKKKNRETPTEDNPFNQ